MGGSRVPDPKNLAEIFNRQLFAAIKTQGDIQRLFLPPPLSHSLFFLQLGETNENELERKTTSRPQNGKLND